MAFLNTVAGIYQPSVPFARYGILSKPEKNSITNLKHLLTSNFIMGSRSDVGPTVNLLEYLRSKTQVDADSLSIPCKYHF